MGVGFWLRTSAVGHGYVAIAARSLSLNALGSHLRGSHVIPDRDVNANLADIAIFAACSIDIQCAIHRGGLDQNTLFRAA